MEIDDLYNYDSIDEYFLNAEQLELEQTLISKKNIHNAYSVERDYINSKVFHDKFEQLPVNKSVQQILYKEAGRLLNFVDGQEEERMIAINARTGKFLIDNFNRKGSIDKTGFNDFEYRNIKDCRDNIVIMHNHSLNGRPSIQDMLTYLKEEKIRLSLIICHDGSVYGIYGVDPKFELIYNKYIEKAKIKTNNEEDIKRLATTNLYIVNNKLCDKHKIFDVKRL